MEHVGIYGLVFGIVCGSYLFLQLFLDMKRRGGEAGHYRNLPSSLRLFGRLLPLFSGNVGRQMARIQPRRLAKIRRQLLAADMNLDPEMLPMLEIFLCMAGLVAGGLGTLLLFRHGGFAVFMALVGALVGAVYPSMTIAGLAERRVHRIIRNLPFAIDLIGSAMRSGLDFSAAVRYYVSAEDATNPLAVEFGVMLHQMELGKNRIEALQDMADRIQVEEFNSFCAAVAHGTEVGASIVDTMKIQGEEMRRARFNLAERKAARAPSIMILPIVLFIMPAVFVVIGTPVYLKLVSSGMGDIMQ